MQARSFLFAAAMLLAGAAHSHSFTLDTLRIGHPYAHPTVPGQPSGAAYLTIENSGKQADHLIGVKAANAKGAELHSMAMQGDVMKMWEVREIEIAPESKVSMKPGDAYHIMLLGLEQPLKLGDKFPVTLTFRKAGKVEVTVVVQDRNKDAASARSGAESSSAPAHKH